MNYLVPDWTNLGDRIVWLGVRQEYGDGNLCLLNDQSDFPKTDRLVVAGTPWIWDQCERSQKYARLRQAIEQHSELHAVGIGACFPFQMQNDPPVNAEALHAIWSRFDRITVRDRTSQEIFDQLGIFAELMPCPSTRVRPNVELADEYNLCVAYDPSRGLSRSALHAGHQQRWRDIHRRLGVDHTWRCIVISQDDCDFARSLGLRPQHVTDEVELFRIIGRARQVVSGRIHSAIPAINLGKPTLTLGLDSRVETVQHLGRPALEVP